MVDPENHCYMITVDSLEIANKMVQIMDKYANEKFGLTNQYAVFGLEQRFVIVCTPEVAGENGEAMSFASGAFTALKYQ